MYVEEFYIPTFRLLNFSFYERGATGFDGDTEVRSCMPRYHGAR